MPKLNLLADRPPLEPLRIALDRLDVIGQWDWDAATDRVSVDGFVALLFNVDPEEAEARMPLSVFIENIHADDRERALSLARRSAQEGGTYLTEDRVISADGVTRWVLAWPVQQRSYWPTSRRQRHLGGHHRMRMSEGTSEEIKAGPGHAPAEWAADYIITPQYAILEM